MVMDPSAPPTPTKSSTTLTPQNTDANRTELEPTPLLLALDMQAERKRLRSRKDSVFTGAEEPQSADEEKEEGESAEEQGTEKVELEIGDGKEVIIPVKEDLSYLVLVGRGVGNAVWSGVEGVRRSVWGVVGWA
jgi:hypothetical protein